MRVFAVVLDEANDGVAERVREAYPDPNNYPMSDTVFLVTADALTKTVATAVGLKGESRVAGAQGVVFRLGSYSGYTDRTLWDWLERSEELV